jgi:uncharacterized membrane protein
MQRSENQANSKRWVLHAPRRSALARRQRWLVFGLICLIGVIFGLFATFVLDAWVVLPFTGLELACVGFAFWWWDQHSNDFEAIVVEGKALQVQRRWGRRSESHELPAAWVQLGREAKPSGWGRRRKLVLACRGKEVTFGEFLNEAAVNEVQRVLRERLKPAWV